MMKALNKISTFPANPKILVTGGTGFIGRPLVQSLIKQGFEVWVLTRHPASYRSKHNLHYIDSLVDIHSSQRIDFIINLAGEPLANKRWNKKTKQIFINSRIMMTKDLYDLVNRLELKPRCLINGSAIGYYGPHADQRLDEFSDSNPCFSHDLCRQWEAQANRFKEFDMRVCILRIGIVLGRQGGAFSEIRKSFDWGVAAQIGHGRQWMSWVHLDDIIQIIEFLLRSTELHGVFNATSPNPATNEFFTSELARVMSAKIKIKMPALFMKLIAGEMAQELLLTGQKVLPIRLMQAGYEFKYPILSSSFESIVDKNYQSAEC